MSGKRRGARALAAAAAGITRQVFAKRGFADGAVVNDWAAIVGPHLAAHSRPEKIAHGPGKRREGTLHLKVDSGSLATELQHLEPQLIERVNAHFGYCAVGRLKLIHGPPPAPQPRPPKKVRRLGEGEEKDLSRRLAAIGDADLRAALEALGRAVKGRRSGEEKDNSD